MAPQTIRDHSAESVQQHKRAGLLLWISPSTGRTHIPAEGFHLHGVCVGWRARVCACVIVSLLSINADRFFIVLTLKLHKVDYC